MQDSADKSTADLLPVVRPRGRPVTGKAKTPAQRQAAYRRNKQMNGESSQRTLNVWLPLTVRLACDRVAAFYGITTSEFLTNMIIGEEHQIFENKLRNKDDFERYLEGKS